MAPLSNLSIGFIVGGSVIFVSIIVIFIIWKVIDSKRHAKSRSVHGEPERASTQAQSSRINGQERSRENARNDSVYSEIIVDGDHGKDSSNKHTAGRTNEQTGGQTNEWTDDSGYQECQIGGSEVFSRLHEVDRRAENEYYGQAKNEDSCQTEGSEVYSRLHEIDRRVESEYGQLKYEDSYQIGGSEVYSRLHEIDRHVENEYYGQLKYADSYQTGGSEVYSRLHEIDRRVENEYNQVKDEDSEPGSHFCINSVSTNRDDTDDYDNSKTMPAFKVSTNQKDQGLLEATPRRTISDKGDIDDYPAIISRFDIIEIHRPATFGFTEVYHGEVSPEEDENYDESIVGSELSVCDTTL